MNDSYFRGCPTHDISHQPNLKRKKKKKEVKQEGKVKNQFLHRSWDSRHWDWVPSISSLSNHIIGPKITSSYCTMYTWTLLTTRGTQTSQFPKHLVGKQNWSIWIISKGMIIWVLKENKPKEWRTHPFLSIESVPNGAFTGIANNSRLNKFIGLTLIQISKSLKSQETGGATYNWSDNSEHTLIRRTTAANTNRFSFSGKRGTFKHFIQLIQGHILVTWRNLVIKVFSLFYFNITIHGHSSWNLAKSFGFDTLMFHV